MCFAAQRLRAQQLYRGVPLGRWRISKGTRATTRASAARNTQIEQFRGNYCNRIRRPTKMRTFIDAQVILWHAAANRGFAVSSAQTEVVMALKRLRGRSIAALMLAASMAIAGYWYFGIFRASEVRLLISEGQVDLSPLGRDWETLCILGPYADNRTAKDLTGIEIDIESRSRSVKYDTFALLVTRDDQRRNRLFDVARHPSDFTNLHATCWPYGTDFLVDPEASWHYVLPPHGN